MLLFQTRIRGHGGHYGQPLLLTAQLHDCKQTPERFWIPFRPSLPTVAPGQNPGALRFVSLALHILPQ